MLWRGKKQGTKVQNNKVWGGNGPSEKVMLKDEKSWLQKMGARAFQKRETACARFTSWSCHSHAVWLLSLNPSLCQISSTLLIINLFLMAMRVKWANIYKVLCAWSWAHNTSSINVSSYDSLSNKRIRLVTAMCSQLVTCDCSGD